MSQSPAEKVLSSPVDLDPFKRDLRRLDDALSRRIDADPESAERGLVELLRELMERQALRRVEAGGLDEETVERVGRTLMALEQRMQELKDHFGFADDELNLDLGPLGRLL
jgi:hypothetical protein